MTQELFFGPPSSESSSSFDGMMVSHVSIADPFVLLWMADESIQLLVGGMFFNSVNYYDAT